MHRLFTALVIAISVTPALAANQPNIVIIFADDLGYGDLGCYGHPTIHTPNLDRMAAEGLKFTNFYVAAPVCTPSRAALLTGRLPIRSGMCSESRRVLFPESAGGIPESEVTLAEALKEKGYATGCFGKWHLGHLPQYLPTKNGFDTYFGIPYSNDMDRVATNSPKGRAAFLEPKIEYWNVPIMRDDKIIERPADQHTITKRYTEEAIKFIKSNKEKPFFVYLPHSMPHVPLFASKEFDGKSARGLYGDVIEEVDWSVGQVLNALREEKLDQKTLVFFTSDNGPWLVFNEHGGSAGPLREGKGSTWEGGMRVPGIAWGPGMVPAGKTTHEMACTMDLYTTAIELAGGKAPDDRPVDGLDISPVLTGKGKSPRDTMIYYRDTKPFAIRHGMYKAHFRTQNGYGQKGAVEHNPPLLFHLGHDPSEKFDIAKDHPQVVAEMRKLFDRHIKETKPGAPQLDKRLK